MKGRTLTLLGILAAIVAAALIIARNYITPLGVVITGGALFILAGLANTIAISRGKASSMGKMFGYMANAASIVFGLCMIVFQSSFVPLVTFIFGLLVAMMAIWQFYVLAAGVKPYTLAAWLYVFPIALSVCAVYILVAKDGPSTLPVILSTGISIAILALGCLLEGGMLGATRRIAIKAGKNAASADSPEGGIAAEKGKGTEEKTSTETEENGMAAPEDEARKRPASIPINSENGHENATEKATESGQ